MRRAAHVEGAVHIQFNGKILDAQFAVDGAVITVEHTMLGAKSARLRGEPPDAIAKILLTELAFESEERGRDYR